MKLIIFDIDGTLMNTNEVDEKCFLDAFGEYLGVDLRKQTWHEFRHVTESSIAEEIFETVVNRKPKPEEYIELKALFLQKLETELHSDRSQFEEVQGALEFFNYLQALDDFNVGIATGSWSLSAKVKLDAISLDYSNIPFSHCDYFISREEIILDVIHKSRNKHNKEFEEIIYFGDGIWDFNTCRNVGIRFIGIDCTNNGKLLNLGTKNVFNDYLDKEIILQVMYNNSPVKK